MPTTTRHLTLTAEVYAARIARNIRSLRRERDIPQKAIQSALIINGFTAQKNTMTKLEQGQETPTLIEALVIAHMLDVDLLELCK